MSSTGKRFEIFTGTHTSIRQLASTDCCGASFEASKGGRLIAASTTDLSSKSCYDAKDSGLFALLMIEMLLNEHEQTASQRTHVCVATDRRHILEALSFKMANPHNAPQTTPSPPAVKIIFHYGERGATYHRRITCEAGVPPPSITRETSATFDAYHPSVKWKYVEALDTEDEDISSLSLSDRNIVHIFCLLRDTAGCDRTWPATEQNLRRIHIEEDHDLHSLGIAFCECGRCGDTVLDRG